MLVYKTNSQAEIPSYANKDSREFTLDTLWNQFVSPFFQLLSWTVISIPNDLNEMDCKNKEK